jgi:hypothetical protein
MLKIKDKLLQSISQTGVETEDNGVPLRPPKVLIDPGQFRYNRRISVVALPVFLLMLSMVGETYVFFS